MSTDTRHTGKLASPAMGGLAVIVWQRTADLDPGRIHISGGPTRTPMALDFCPRCKEFFRVIHRISLELVTDENRSQS